MIFCHVTPLVLALAMCDADSVVNGTPALLRSQQIKNEVQRDFGN